MLTILSAAIAPALALLTFFYLKDRLEPEPLSMVLRTFLYGALLVFPIMFIQYALQAEGIGTPPIVYSFFTIGFLEEFFKWFIFLYTAFRHTEMDSVYDGIIYGVSISLGFATVENVLYLFAHGVDYAFTRALFPVSSHALFGVLMGYYLGRAKFGSKHPRLRIAAAMLIPFLLHGFYDYILVVVQFHWIYIQVPFMIILWTIGLRKVRAATNHPIENIQTTKL
ncbi:Membrane proteinase PrsW, cleaves anti-sigma factor RsiW, M82 family [Terribacillus aidingensis]|uniref:Protease PrsW n=1 Tax=Terribacillus aidingensis TaxID=586416 RepID=A0A285NRC0_9BACI|nr:glutamic-type intramembrane protease PrsW [Terribacillus aidingensis]SNZ10406.1 Membrane proteinase PrsW, cleaves anti-sigma factor RsiW, M82 family [Terribacillus aidingensis]